VSDFGYGCGFVTVDFGGTSFGPATKHHLSVYDGKLAIAGEGVVTGCHLNRHAGFHHAVSWGC